MFFVRNLSSLKWSSYWDYSVEFRLRGLRGFFKGSSCTVWGLRVI